MATHTEQEGQPKWGMALDYVYREISRKETQIVNLRWEIDMLREVVRLILPRS